MTGRLFAWALALLGVTALSAQPRFNELLVFRPTLRATPEKAAGGETGWRELAPGILHIKYADSLAAAGARRMMEKRYPDWQVSYNYQVTTRAVPDDPEYFRQENMLRAGYEEAWNATTGGRTPDGRDIVIAILDDGFDIAHPDLVGNLWRNPEEIPGDGRDNDGNGYVDDVTGWNFVAASPRHPAATHGTSVAGLIGASGNNGIGVAGTNWNVQLMPFTINTVADIVAAYQYVIDQRAQYNTTGGQGGAFVVATNASFGVEGATCADFPAWGAMYDRLGAVGILTAGSVVTTGINVDTDGDVPVDCPSEALIGVTNLGQDDLRLPSAGFGRVSVDLAAPGEGSYTTRPEGRYGNFGSTSAAAPYVTGAIALLYATPGCASLSARALTAPAATAAEIRRSILSSVRAIPSLVNTTATGGTLDVAAAQRALLAGCGDGAEEFTLDAVWPVPAANLITVATRGMPLRDGLRVSVRDMLGRTFPSPIVTRLSDHELRVDLGWLPAGVYYLTVENEAKTASTKILLHGR